MTMRDSHNDSYGLGRLKPQVTQAQARAQMASIAQRLQREYPKENAGIEAQMVPLRERLPGLRAPSFSCFWGRSAWCSSSPALMSPTCSCRGHLRGKGRWPFARRSAPRVSS